MNDGVSWRARMTAIGAATVLAALSFPQLAMAAPASGSAASSATAVTSAVTPPSTSVSASTASLAAIGRAQSEPSGTDASCPAANDADAASTTVSAPAHPKAIPGSASATVVWCPPADGASQVTSYLVTAEPGGASVTADVPNDWAIIDGLTDGTHYTFTITANTKSASGAQAQTATTATAVTPEAIARPDDVVTTTPQTVSYDQYSMIIGGRHVFITAGEFDPWRTPSPSLWLDDLEKMKADGYDAVTTYFDWDYNSPSPGDYDFTGVRNYDEFLNMAQEAGLYVIARPGPYINAETDGGGIPSWVLTAPNGYRTDTEPYLSAALQWLSEIDPIIAAHQTTNGGDVIAYQVENEYANPGTAADDYMAAIEQQAASDGINVPFTFNQCCGSQTYTTGTGAVNISGTDNYPLGFDCEDPTSFGQPQSGYPVYDEPVYLPEYQGGSFDGWGGSGYADCYEMTGPDFENVYYKDNVIQGVTMQSNYMGVGGTNWGWLPAPQVYTSYDYGAAISETGEIGPPSDPNDIAGSKYGENKLINDFETSVAPLTETVSAAAPTPDNPDITTVDRVNPNDDTQFVYVRQSDATSTATATTHIALNADEAAGYTDDDTSSALAYTGGWTHANTANSNYTGGDYDGTESWSTQAGASVSVAFTGTAVQWIGPKDTNGGIADVSIDGTQVATVDTYDSAGKEDQQVLYSASGLSAGPHTLTITVTGTEDAASSADTVVVDAINVPTATELDGYFPQVPQSGTITLDGRDSRLLVANYQFGTGQDLVYSTSEIMTQAAIGDQDELLLYDPAGTGGETVLHYASQPKVTAVSGSATSTWDASRDDLRLDYVHNGLTEVEITGGGAAPLELLIADTNTAEDLWPMTTSAGTVLVEGGYLVRTASVRNGRLSLTGDTSEAGKLTVWAGPAVRSVEWNGSPVATTANGDGSLTGTIPGPQPVKLPQLTDWKFASEAPEAQPGFDDSDWTLADHPGSNASSPSTPVLYASDYGYDHGFVWYRGHFTATGSETGVTLTVDGIAPTGAYSAWLNGAFLGSGSAAGAQTQTFTFPSGILASGKDNTIAILVENTGNPEGPSGEKVGLYSASLAGSSAAISWRLMGDPGGSTLQDTVRGVMNPSGLFGADNGWDLPGYPDASWEDVTLPDSWSARGVPAGIGWYRTTFSLNLPSHGYVPIDVQIGGPGPGAGTADYRAFIYVNGWLIGRYVNNVGPQHQFYVPAGILNDDGDNTLAIAVWGLDQAGGGLAAVSLVATGDQQGGAGVTPVESPGYNPAVYGAPAALLPTLTAVPSTTLATSSFTVTDTLRNPTRAPLRSASLSLAAPAAGWTVSPSGPVSVGTVAPGGSASETFTVTAPSSVLSAGAVSLSASAGYDGSSRRLLQTATVNVPSTSLAATFNNTAITDNSDPSPTSGFIGFDGEGTSYSAEGLAADGVTPGSTVSSGGVSFTWPDVASGEPDNTMAEGQTIAVSGSGTSLGFLAAANNSAESGTGTIYYTDGTTQTFTLDVGNFWDGSGDGGNPSNTTAATVNYANYPTGSSGHTVYVFEQNVALESGKTVEAVTLPDLGGVAGYNPALHVFAMAIGG
jgi:beta-galactosidase GanA